MNKYLLVALVLIVAGCDQQKNETNASAEDSGYRKAVARQSYDDSLLQSMTKKAIADREKEPAEEEISDSMRLEKLQAKVMDAVKQNLFKKAFKGEAEDSSGNRKGFAYYECGNIFSSDRKHLLVKRFLDQGFGSDLVSDAYLVTNGGLKIVFSDTAEYMYSGDTLTDVNGDGYKDFVVSAYSGAGCCPRDARTAYIYNRANGKFVTEYFFNPEFDFKNKLVYEMSYGQPGSVQLEKYKWKGMRKILTEVITPTLKNGEFNSFVKPYTFTRISYPGEKVTILKTLPEEYKRLKHYEYFIDYQ